MVVQRMIRLLRKQGKEEKELMDYIGLQPKSMKNWKYAGSYGYMKYIKEICEFWDTTPNYLFYGPEKEEDKLSLEEMKILRKYRRLSSAKKKRIMDELRELTRKSDENELKLRG